jgi:hypothetical protein
VFGAWTPKPRKLRADSSRIADDIASVAATMMTPMVLGRMCRKMIRPLDAPTERAASTNSFSRSDRNSPRTMRARPVQVTKPMKSPSPHTPPTPPEIWATTAATASSGIVMITSVSRMSTDSVTPRK